MAVAKCIVFILLFYFVNSSTICTEEFCETFIKDTGCGATSNNCRINNATHSGLSMLSPTRCNCCEYCMPFYLEGEHCSIGGPGTGTTIGRCGDGLTCALDDQSGDTRCTRLTSPCHKLQDEFDERQQRGQVGSLEERPRCDGKGKHAPTQCVPTQTCFCQTEAGERIFGEAPYRGPVTIQNMQCKCSLFNEKIKKVISSGLSHPVIGPRCTSDGNFNPVQCLNRTCYCVNPITGVKVQRIESIDLDEEYVSSLECYDQSLDLFPPRRGEEAPFEYTSPCYSSLQRQSDLVQQSIEEGYDVSFGGGFTECYPDGTFGRIAYTNTGLKVCIDDHGRQIGDYHAEPGTAAFDKMDCKCALTSHIMGSAEEKPTCCKNGNFRGYQCRRGMCHCVDSDGRQTVRETDNINLLTCYTPEWINC